MFVSTNQYISFHTPGNLLPIITLTHAPRPPFVFSFFFFLRFVIGEFEVKRACIAGQTLDGIFADIVVYLHCAFNEL